MKKRKAVDDISRARKKPRAPKPLVLAPRVAHWTDRMVQWLPDLNDFLVNKVAPLLAIDRPVAWCNLAKTCKMLLARVPSKAWRAVVAQEMTTGPYGYVYSPSNTEQNETFGIMLKRAWRENATVDEMTRLQDLFRLNIKWRFFARALHPLIDTDQLDVQLNRLWALACTAKPDLTSHLDDLAVDAYEAGNHDLASRFIARIPFNRHADVIRRIIEDAILNGRPIGPREKGLIAMLNMDRTGIHLSVTHDTWFYFYYMFTDRLNATDDEFTWMVTHCPVVRDMEYETGNISITRWNMPRLLTMIHEYPPRALYMIRKQLAKVFPHWFGHVDVTRLESGALNMELTRFVYGYRPYDDSDVVMAYLASRSQQAKGDAGIVVGRNMLDAFRCMGWSFYMDPSPDAPPATGSHNNLATIPWFRSTWARVHWHALTGLDKPKDDDIVAKFKEDYEKIMGAGDTDEATRIHEFLLAMKAYVK